MSDPRPAVSRNAAIDAARFIGFLAVLFIHVIIWGAVSPDTPTWAQRIYPYLTQLGRFAVPLFFIVSGYFLARDTGPALESILRLAKRILPVYAVWLIIYLLASADYLAGVHGAHQIILTVFTGGPGYHLWFLPSLFLSAAAFVILRKLLGQHWLPGVLVIGGLSYLAGVALGPYENRLSLPEISWPMRAGPVLGLFLLTLGAAASEYRFRPKWPLALALAVAGGVLQIAEVWVIGNHMAPDAPNPDMVLATPLFGFGVFALALSLEKAPIPDWMPNLGRLVLWMYCIHVLILNMFAPVKSGQPLVLAGVYVAVLAVTILSALGISRIKALKAFYS